MRNNRAYKYRFGGDYFERDLSSIEQNYFWAPHYLDLNDPCETLVFTDDIKSQSNLLANLFGVKGKALDNFNNALENLLLRKSKIGIYSLSTSFSHELLWAHYANSHKGFCIEYDLNKLVKTNIYHDFNFSKVNYSKRPPSININDVSNNLKNIIQKIASTKSQAWSYEEEIRIITDTIGKNYYEYSAITKIYFGFRMIESQKHEVMRRLKGRGISYYQISLEKNSYKFNAKLVEDEYKNAASYLNEFNGMNSVIQYEIMEKSYDFFSKKGIVHVKLPQVIVQEELESLAKDLRLKLFLGASRIFMFYLLPNMKINRGAWATTHFANNEFNVSINSMTFETEKIFLEEIKNDKRNLLRSWLDYTPYSFSKLILYQENGEFILETSYRDGSKSEDKLELIENDQITKYQTLKKNHHGEYVQISQKGILEFYSPDGKYNEIDPLDVSIMKPPPSSKTQKPFC